MVYKATFVAEFEDDNHPKLSASTEILGGKLCAFSWRDDLAAKDMLLDAMKEISSGVLDADDMAAVARNAVDRYNSMGA